MAILKEVLEPVSRVFRKLPVPVEIQEHLKLIRTSGLASDLKHEVEEKLFRIIRNREAGFGSRTAGFGGVGPLNLFDWAQTREGKEYWRTIDNLLLEEPGSIEKNYEDICREVLTKKLKLNKVEGDKQMAEVRDFKVVASKRVIRATGEPVTTERLFETDYLIAGSMVAAAVIAGALNAEALKSVDPSNLVVKVVELPNSARPCDE